MGGSKKLIWSLVIGALLLCFCCCGGISLVVMRTVKSVTETKNESLAYSDASVRAISKSWDPNELESRASSVFKGMVSHDKMKQIASSLSKKYGPLKQLVNSYVGNWSTSSTTNSPSNLQVVTWTQCQFTKGPGVIEMTVSKHESQWQIDGFYVREPNRPQ